MDLSKISMEDFKESIVNRYLVPSQEILRENVDANFEVLINEGITTMHDLQQAIKTQKKVEIFSQKTGLDIQYASTLRREVNSYHPKPKNLKEFPGVNLETVENLGKLGIKTTMQLFDHILTPEKRDELASQAKAGRKDIDELAGLTDLVRIKWVGHVYARMMYDAGYDSACKVSQADPKELYDKLMEINKDKQYTKSNFAFHDIQLTVKVAKDVPLDIGF